jgi:hypothetical protein
MDIEPRDVTHGSALSTKQRILQSTTSSSNTKPRVPPINVPPRKQSLGSLGFKKMPVPDPSRTASGSKDVKPQQGLVFAELNGITSSPISYHQMQDSIPQQDDYQQQDDESRFASMSSILLHI